MGEAGALNLVHGLTAHRVSGMECVQGHVTSLNFGK